MRDFDQNRFDINATRTKDELISAAPERPGEDAPAPDKRPFWEVPIVRIVAIVLLMALAINILYTVLVHPIDRLNTRLLLSPNYEMELQVAGWSGGQYYIDYAIIRVDGNLIAIGSSRRHFDYYKVENGALYEYVEINNKWVRVDDYEYDDSLFYSRLFDRRNFERVKGSPFVWQSKDGYVKFKQSFGKYTFTWGYYTLTFNSFGITPIKPPDEK